MGGQKLRDDEWLGDDRFTPGNFNPTYGGNAEELVQRMQRRRNAQATRQGALNAAREAYNSNPNDPAAQSRYRTAASQANEAYRAALAGGQQPPKPAPAPAQQQAKPSLGDNAKPAPAPAAPAAAPQSNVLGAGKPGEPGYARVQYSGKLPAPGSNFRNFGYDPAEAQQVQASPNYRQIGANTYMTNRGLMIQGDEGVADYFSRFQHAPSTPIWTPAPQRQAAPQPQMPEAPKGGWKTQRAVYQAQMDAYNREQDRQHALELARLGDARAAQRFGFDQEQARQAMDLQRAQLGLQADQNAVNQAKAMSDMELAARGIRKEDAMFGYQQNLAEAIRSGDPKRVGEALAMWRAVNGKDAEEKTGRGRFQLKDGIVLDRETGTVRNLAQEEAEELVRLKSGLPPEIQKELDPLESKEQLARLRAAKAGLDARKTAQ